MSATYSRRYVQNLPVTLNQAWDFFSNPANLAKITPADLGFKIRSKHHGDRMYPGLLIEYTVRPVLGIPLYWMTEITHVEEKKFFVDEQRFGPYALWHHQHHFKEIAGCVEMTDIIHYRIPFWVIGDLANSLFVGKRLDAIFRYRYETAVKEFGAWDR